MNQYMYAIIITNYHLYPIMWSEECALSHKFDNQQVDGIRMLLWG